MTTLRFPDPTTTTRPDIPVADAYLIDGVESEVVDADYFVLPFASDVEAAETVTPLTLLCSVDHGLRTADETSAVVGINIAAEVLAPFIIMTGGDPTTLDWWGAMCSVLEVDGWTGGWLPDEHEDLDIHAWSHDMETAAWSAGLVPETSGDSGMSWLYAPMCDPIERADQDDDQDDDEAVNRADWWIQTNIGGRASGDVHAVARAVLAGIEEGDPAVLDALDGADESTVAAACRDLLTDDQD